MKLISRAGRPSFVDPRKFQYSEMESEDFINSMVIIITAFVARKAQSKLAQEEAGSLACTVSSGSIRTAAALLWGRRNLSPFSIIGLLQPQYIWRWPKPEQAGVARGYSWLPRRQCLDLA